MENALLIEDPVAFRQALLRWYSCDKRDLPWRTTRDPYAIWTSEVMLQQTQVKTVLPYYSRWMRIFPAIADLAAADLQQVLKCWEGLGYYSRARKFHEAARMIIGQHGGKIPDNYRDFLALPGVGPYTAAAVMSIAFAKSFAVVDGNVKRVLARLCLISEPVNVSSTKQPFQEVADLLLDVHSSGDYNQALMELGALICRPRNPGCTVCPVASFCAASGQERVADFPQRLARKQTPLYHLVVGVVQHGDRLLITRRPQNGLLGGLWEFPGGRIQPGESAELACRRVLRETVNVEAGVGELLAQVKHAYTHFRIDMQVFLCRSSSEAVKLQGPEAFAWIAREELQQYAFPKANNKFIPLLKEPPPPIAGGVSG